MELQNSLFNFSNMYNNIYISVGAINWNQEPKKSELFVVSESVSESEKFVPIFPMPKPILFIVFISLFLFKTSFSMIHIYGRMINIY